MYALDVIPVSSHSKDAPLAQPQPRASSSGSSANIRVKPRRRSAYVKKTGPPKPDTQKELDTEASQPVRNVNPGLTGLITPAPSMQRLPSILPISSASPGLSSSAQPNNEETQEEEERPGSMASNASLFAGQWPIESTLCSPTKATEDDDFSGFQMLDPLQCIMLPWTNISMTERSLYVPPALGNLLHRMSNRQLSLRVMIAQTTPQI